MDLEVKRGFADMLGIKVRDLPEKIVAMYDSARWLYDRLGGAEITPQMAVMICLASGIDLPKGKTKHYVDLDPPIEDEDDDLRAEEPAAVGAAGESIEDDLDKDESGT